MSTAEERAAQNATETANDTSAEASPDNPTVSPDDIAEVTRQLLAAHPQARLVAINEMGMFVPMPPAVPMTQRQQVIEGYSSALEFVASDDIVAIVDAWQHVRQYGQSRADVRPNTALDTTMTMHFLDTRSVYGVLLGLVTGDGAEYISGARGDGDAMRPRLIITRQSQDGFFTQVDEAMETILGHTGMVGRPAVELVHPADTPRVVGVWMEMLARPGCSRRLRFRQRHLDGHWVWFEVTLRNLLNNPDERSVIVEMIDISDEMAAHEYVVAQENLLRRLTDSLPVGVVQVDSQGQIMHRNPLVNELIGHPDALTIHDLLADVVDADAGKVGDATRAGLADVDSDVEISVARAGGEVRRFQVTLRALKDAAGGPSGCIFCISDVTEPARLRDQLQHRATFDPLTGCHNRSSVLQELGRVLAAAADSLGVAVVFIDLDGFKLVNDRRGHAAGDVLLREVAHCLQAAVRTNDVVGRFGGDEFIVLYADVNSAGQALELAQRLTAALATAFAPEPPHAAVASIGVAWLAGNEAAATGADNVLSRADTAMYQSKARGDGQPVLFDSDVMTGPTTTTAR